MIEGENCRIHPSLRVLGKGEILLSDDVQIGRDVTINVSEKLEIGSRSIIGDYALIEGRDIELGTEFWSDRYIQIGGGSCFESRSSLKMGYWGHMGRNVYINTARSVNIGDEVGLGTGTKLYTHGAYLSFLDGFPVDFAPINIGSRVWIPGATVLPGVTIGPDTVVGVGSVVTKSLPGGCLAMGVPARVIRENEYPKKNQDWRVQMIVFLMNFNKHIAQVDAEYLDVTGTILMKHQEGETAFNLKQKLIKGPVSELTEKLRNELRRYGVRFKSYPKDGVYVPWEGIR